MPPSVGPTAGPRITLMLKNPIARPRRSGGKTLKSVNIVSDCSTPAISPCTTRVPISTLSLGLAPAEAVHEPCAQQLTDGHGGERTGRKPLRLVLADAEGTHDVGQRDVDG